MYFPRDNHEEEIAATKLPADVGDENGETVISERKIRISALPGVDGFPISTQPFSGDVTPSYRSAAIKRWIFGSHYVFYDNRKTNVMWDQYLITQPVIVVLCMFHVFLHLLMMVVSLYEHVPLVTFFRMALSTFDFMVFSWRILKW